MTSSVIEVKANPRRHRLANGRHGGWRPPRPAPHQDWGISQRFAHIAAVHSADGLVALKHPEHFPKIRDQGTQGSCGGHSARSCLYYSFMNKHGEKLQTKWGRKWDLSPAGIYYRAREAGNYVTSDDGVTNRLLWDAIRAHGAPTEASCPYRSSKLTTKLSAEAVKTGRWHQATANTYRCDDPADGGNRQHIVDRMLQALAADMPIHIGFTCFTNLEGADATGVVPLPGRGDSEEGGHDVAVFWADTANRVFWGPNSWSGAWGGQALTGAQYSEKGYIGIPFDYILKGYADDIWAVEIE